MRGARRVYAVVRLDRYKSLEDPNSSITVKEILPTQAEAEREVARLTALKNSG